MKRIYWLPEEIPAWHIEGISAEVAFGLFDSNGGTGGEMVVAWFESEDHRAQPTPRLEVFSDGWAALASFSDLITELGAIGTQPITPDEFCRLLERCGFTHE